MIGRAARVRFAAVSRPLHIGHRGAAALAPENSLEGIEAALAAGLDGVELDVVLANRRLWLAHSLVELRQTSPTLEQGLALLAEREGLVLLDLKGPGFEAEVVHALRRHDLLGRTLVASFYPRVLRAVRALEPELPRGLSYPPDRLGVGGRGVPAPLLRAGLAGLRRALVFRLARMLRGAGANAALLHHLVVSRPVVDRCRALEAPVFAWTVNDVAALRRVERLHVDGIVTDDPRLFGRTSRSA
jgi:glycerophosphoryl diester phosphodiesterase